MLTPPNGKINVIDADDNSTLIELPRKWTIHDLHIHLYLIKLFVKKSSWYYNVLCAVYMNRFYEWLTLNSSRLWRNRRQFANNICKCIFLNENVLMSIKILLKFIPKGPINNIPALIQIMVWCWPGDKPLSEPMMVRLLTHICITQPQWVIQLKMHGRILSKVATNALVLKH